MEDELIKDNYFAQLLNGIYGRINLQVTYSSIEGSKFSKPVIQFRGNTFYKKSFTNARQKHYDEIFYLTFCAPVIDFRTENKSVLDRTDVVRNAILYFQKYDVKIPTYFFGETNNKILCKAIYTAISTILLPIIFRCENDKQILDKKYEEIKAEIKAHFAGVELGYLEGLNVVANDYEVIYDSNYSKENLQKSDDTYAIPVDRSRVESDIYIHFPVNYVSIGIKPDERDRYTLKRIIGNYQKYPFKDDEPFIDPFAGQSEEYAANSIKHSEDLHFTLSKEIIPAQYFVPRYFYYITCINEYVINNYNASRSDFNRIDHSELDKILIKRATVDFRHKHKEDISEYYRRVIRYIEDMIKRISTADYCPIIRRDTDVEVCQKFAKNFNIDYEKIIEYIEEDDCIQTVYQLIEDEVLKFVRNIARYNNSFSQMKLADELKEFLPYVIKGHYHNICDYIESKTLSEAISLCDKILLEEKDRNNACESPKQGPNGSGNFCDNLIYVQRKLASKNKYYEIHQTLEGYCGAPENKYNEIYQTLKDYCDALKSVIDS